MRTTLITLLAALCLSVSSVLAQDSSLSASTIASSIDAGASVYGLPGGNGAISPAEQALGTAISQEIAATDQSITAFAQAGKANSALVDAVEGRVAESFDPRADAISNAVNRYGQDNSSPSASDPRADAISHAVDQYGQDNSNPSASDPRADAISHAVDQYGQDSGNSPAVDPRAQAISDAIAQYGQENAGSTAPDPRAQAISEAVNQYGQDSGNSSGRDPRADAISNAVAQYGRDVVDPRAQAISNAVAQYGQEQGSIAGTAQGQQRINQAIERGVNSAVDGSSVQHKSMVKKRIQQFIQVEVPSTNLPINGYWRPRPFSMSMSGHCKADNGDNDGPSAEDPEHNPGLPLCGYANSPNLPFIVWQNEDHPYLPGTGSIYSQEPSVRYEAMHDSQGNMISSVKVTVTTEYRVVSPTEIHVHLVMQEDGGCTLSGDYVLELVTADDSICVANKPFSTPEPTPTPPPQTQGPFRVGSPIFNDANDCDDSNRPPQFSDAFLREQPDGTTIFDYGTGQQLMYFRGNGNYDSDAHNGSGGRLVFGVTIFDDGSGGSIFWSNKSSNGKMCVASIELTNENADAISTPIPAPGQSSDGPATVEGQSGDSSDGAFVLPTGHFAVTWAEYPGLACAADLVTKLPKFPEATISRENGAYSLDGAGATYALTDQGGTAMYMNIGADNSSTIMAFNGFDEDGNVVGSFVYASADGKNCMNMLTLKAIP